MPLDPARTGPRFATGAPPGDCPGVIRRRRRASSHRGDDPPPRRCSPEPIATTSPPTAAAARQARRSWIELEFPSAANFDDPKHEWRRLFSELLGTFFLVLVGAGGAVVTAKSGGAIARSAAVTGPGLMVMAIILFMGSISGAHLNPAVSIAFATRGDFPWRRVPGYVIVQLIGATSACLFLWAMLGKVGGLGSTEPGAGIANWQAMLMEFVLTVGLVSVILGTASSAQNIGTLSAVAVGGYIILAGLWSSPISGASMNPARSFGPDLANGDFGNYWVYIVGPIAGAVSACGIAWILRGKGGDLGGMAAARGDDETVDARRAAAASADNHR